jgi:chemotaxis protein MotB
MPDEKLARVTGLASSNLLDPQNPLSPTNRRISIIVMTREAEERLMGGGRTPAVTAAEAPAPTAPTEAKQP